MAPTCLTGFNFNTLFKGLFSFVFRLILSLFKLQSVLLSYSARGLKHAVSHQCHRNMDGNKLLELYEQMLLMRRFEEAAAQAYTQRKIGGFLHLYIGQEAVGAGVLAALEKKDQVITSYRDHAQYLARGGTAKEGMAELFGKATGCSQGRGGSMHFFDAKNNFMGGWGIVGAHVPIASGLAFANKYKGDDSVAVCFLGDGACSIGPFHEGLC